MCNVKIPPKGPPSDRLLRSLRQAFFDLGYEAPTMVDLAKACGVTRRTLYNHCVNKLDAFRAMLRWRHEIEIAAGMEAGRRALAAGGSVLDAVVAMMDSRYGEARRDLGQSAHAVEINYSAFRHCRDVMVASAVDFQAGLADWLAELTAGGKLRLKPGVTASELAQMLADGARGVNQSLPPLPAEGLPERYRQMFAAILWGCAARDEEDESRSNIGK